MDVFEAMSTMRSVRLFTDEPVSDEQLERIMRMAQFAPNGSNDQRYRFIVVRDSGQRAAIGRLYRDGILHAMGLDSIDEAVVRAANDGYMRREVVALAKDMPATPPVLIFAGGTGNWHSEPGGVGLSRRAEPLPRRLGDGPGNDHHNRLAAQRGRGARGSRCTRRRLSRRADSPGSPRPQVWPAEARPPRRDRHSRPLELNRATSSGVENLSTFLLYNGF